MGKYIVPLHILSPKYSQPAVPDCFSRSGVPVASVAIHDATYGSRQDLAWEVALLRSRQF